MNATDCRSCKAPIVWMLTKNGKRIPVDAGTIAPDYAGLYDPAAGHKSHFGSCPHAKTWSKKGQK